MNLLILILLIIQFIGIINGMIFFFIMAKVNIKDWIFLNSCSASSILLIIGYILKITLKNEFILYISMTLILYFGCLGLLKATWKGLAMLTQIIHISMILNVIVILYSVLINKNSIILLTGISIGIIVIILIKVAQKKYFKTRLEILRNNPVLCNYL